MKRNSLIISSIIIFTLTSCLKSLFEPEKETLPNITQNGSHTFGCKVDGKIWIPTGVHEIYGTSIAALTASFCVEPNRNSFYITISAVKDYENKVEGLHIRINSNSAGTYILNGAQMAGYGYPSYAEFDGFETDSLRTGVVVLNKVDLLNNIIAGTFEFTGIDKRNGKICKITEGRFDAKTR